MLDLTLKHLDEFKKKHMATWFNPKYIYYNYRCYYDAPEIKESTWNSHDFISLDKEGNVIGNIYYNIDRAKNDAYGLGIICYDDNSNTIFGRDVLCVIKDIFEKFHFHKLSCSVVIGNPIEKTYDRLIPKYGGRIVGIEKEEAKLIDGKYYDVKRYEILREDYMKAKENNKCTD